MFCSQCGRSIVDGSNFCQDCGRRLPDRAPSVDSSNPPASLKVATPVPLPNLGPTPSSSAEIPLRIASVLAGIVCLGLLGWGLVAWDNGTFPMESSLRELFKATKTAVISGSEDQMALQDAKDLITKLLVSPGSAQWVSTSVVEKQPPSFLVRTVVDSQNQFGALVRSDYFVCLQVTGPTTYSYQPVFGVTEANEAMIPYQRALFKAANGCPDTIQKLQAAQKATGPEIEGYLRNVLGIPAAPSSSSDGRERAPATARPSGEPGSDDHEMLRRCLDKHEMEQARKTLMKKDPTGEYDVIDRFQECRWPPPKYAAADGYIELRVTEQAGPGDNEASGTNQADRLEIPCSQVKVRYKFSSQGDTETMPPLNLAVGTVVDSSGKTYNGRDGPLVFTPAPSEVVILHNDKEGLDSAECGDQ